MSPSTEDTTHVKPPDRKPAHFNSLPSKLKCQVAGHLGTGALKSLCLTNRIWVDAVLPVLWGTLYSKLLIGTGREVRALTDEGSNITKHLREIVLTRRNKSYSAWDDSWQESYRNSALPILLASLQRNQLRRFESVSGCSESELLTCFCLNEIKDLVVDFKSMDEVLKHPFISERLSHLKHLTLVGSRTEPEPFKLDLFSKNTRTLELLELKTISDETTQSIDLGPQRMSEAEAAAPTIVKTLTLRMSILQNAGTFSNYIDVFQIQKIEMHRVQMSLNLLDVLAAAYRENQFRDPQLKFFRLTGFWWNWEDAWHFSTPAQRLADFLLSFKGLQTLHVQGCMETEKLSSLSISHHRETLTELLYVTDDTSDEQKFRDPISCFDHLDVQVIANSCERLEHLCLNLHEFGLGMRTNFARQLNQPQPTGLVKAISAIARLPRLKILRLTNLPAYRKAANVEICRQEKFRTRWIQGGKIYRSTEKCAIELLRYIKGIGSGIELLAISPARPLGNDAALRGDAAARSLNRWPKYYFEPCTKIRNGEEIVTAVDVQDGTLLFPDTMILKGFQQPEDSVDENYEDEVSVNQAWDAW